MSGAVAQIAASASRVATFRARAMASFDGPFAVGAVFRVALDALLEADAAAAAFTDLAEALRQASCSLAMFGHLPLAVSYRRLATLLQKEAEARR